MSTMTVRIGTAVFQTTVILLLSASQRTPRMLKAVKSAMRMTAKTRPLPSA